MSEGLLLYLYLKELHLVLHSPHVLDVEVAEVGRHLPHGHSELELGDVAE